MDFGALGCSQKWGLEQNRKHGECLSKIIGLVDWYVGHRVPGLAGRFAGMVGGIPDRLARFAGRVARFNGGLTGYARFAIFAGFVL